MKCCSCEEIIECGQSYIEFIKGELAIHDSCMEMPEEDEPDLDDEEEIGEHGIRILK